MTIYYLKDVIACRKKHIRNHQVQTIHVPAYENLTLKHIGDFAAQHPAIADYFPDAPDLDKVPKQWICNVLAAVIGQPFRDWVKQQI